MNSKVSPSQKKPYERPELKKVDFFEAGSTGCCKLTTGACTTAIRNTMPGKSRSSATS